MAIWSPQAFPVSPLLGKNFTFPIAFYTNLCYNVTVSKREGNPAYNVPTVPGRRTTAALPRNHPARAANGRALSGLKKLYM